MRNDIFIQPNLPLLVATGKQIAVEPWVYKCMVMVGEARLKLQGVGEQDAALQANTGLKEAGFVALSSRQTPSGTQNGRNARDGKNGGSGRGPLSGFFK